MPGKSKTLPYAAAILAAVVWGFSFLFTKDALGYLRPFQLLGCRFLVAAAAMTVLVAARAVRVRLTRAKLKGLLPVALLQPVLYFTGETLGVARTTVSESGVVIALVPIAITLCSVLLLRERLSPAKWGAVALCAGGVVLIVLSGGWSAGRGGERLPGVLALLAAVAAAGFYTPLSRKVSASCTPAEVTFVMMWVGAIVFSGIGLGEAAARGELGGYFSGIAGLRVVADIAYLGVLSSVVAFFCLNFALSRLPSTVVGTFINLAPAIAVFAGVVIHGDRLGWMQCAGTALILLGIWGAARSKAAVAGESLPAQAE